MYTMLKEAHPQKYKQMGSPTLFWNNSPRAMLNAIVFLWKREYRALNDKKLESHCDRMFYLHLAYMILFVLLFIKINSMMPS